MKAADVLTMIKENEIRFVDLRFTDTRGKEQHVTLPAHPVDDEVADLDDDDYCEDQLTIKKVEAGKMVHPGIPGNAARILRKK
ncbi:MAG: hypothetical protein IH809_03210 [Proteobacteria bacterium]|nr:hypothetical protein [Pseudomonadota bacterium]